MLLIGSFMVLAAAGGCDLQVDPGSKGSGGAGSTSVGSGSTASGSGVCAGAKEEHSCAIPILAEQWQSCMKATTLDGCKQDTGKITAGIISFCWPNGAKDAYVAAAAAGKGTYTLTGPGGVPCGTWDFNGNPDGSFTTTVHGPSGKTFTWAADSSGKLATMQCPGSAPETYTYQQGETAFSCIIPNYNNCPKSACP